MMPRYFVARCCAIMVLLPGCASDNSPGEQPREGGATAAAQPVNDPVLASAARERAMTIIEQLSQSEDARVRANAVEAATLAPARLKAVISAGLLDPTPAVRTVALLAAGKGKHADMTDRARVLLKDDSPYVRAAAIYALTRCGAEVDRSPLATILLTDPSPQVRAHAAFILGELGDPSALPLLRQSVRQPMPRVSPERQRLFELQAVEAMIKLGDDEQRPVVRAALYPNRPEELEATALAVQIIGEIEDAESAYQLVSLSAFKDVNGNLYPAEVRLGIAAALATLGNTKGAFIADEYAQNASPVIRAQAAHVFGKAGGLENWSKLERLLNDPEPVVQVSAAAAVLRSAS